MRVKILGSAAGGGFPQWNCACHNCSSLRAGAFSGKARTQAQVAVSHDSRSWFLLGASPDLRTQIEATRELHPRGIRDSPITGVVLANADLDHVLGLLLLRELQPLQIYATPSVLGILRERNSMFRMLNRVPDQAVWTNVKPGINFQLRSAAAEDSGLHCEMLSMGNHFPTYVDAHAASSSIAGEASLGIIVESLSGKRLAYFPAVPEIDDELLQRLETTDLLLFDGTFWSADELIRVQGSGQTARQMGHIPVGSQDGSLRRLARLQRPRRMFLHINNTNPMLDESGSEFRALRDAGWELAEDGWQFDL